MAVCVLAVLLPAACGVPENGQVQTVDDDDVPYHLLDPEQRSPGDSNDNGETRLRSPRVYWLVDDRLSPSATTLSCTGAPVPTVDRLLVDLASGPTDEDRARGRSTAIPPESTLTLVSVVEGLATVEIDPASMISPDRLPAAVAQIVLTVTSAPGVGSVLFVDADAPVPVPQPGGALATGPVTAEDYDDLLPLRHRTPSATGCA